MVAPVHVLDVCQVGIEATRGTLVPATRILDHEPGGVTLKRTPTIIRVRNAGSLATSHRSYPGKDVIEIDVSGTWTYNWAPWWFNHFLGPLSAGVGAGADKVWAFTGAEISDTADNLKSSSWEVSGKDARPGEYKVAGVMGQKLSLSIKQDQAWTYKASLIGQVVTIAAKTGALSTAATITDVLGTLTKVYIDTSSAFGTTQRVGAIVSADIDITVGTNPRYTLDGQRNPYRMAVTGNRTIGAKIVAEYDAQTEYTATHADTAKRVRVKATGPTLGGSTYICQLDLPGTWDSHEFGDDGGVVTEMLTLTGQYDATPASDVNASVTTDSATLP